MAPDNQNKKGKTAVEPEGTTANQKYYIMTEQQATWKIHSNELHTKLFRRIEDRIRAAAKHLQYRVKGALEV